MQGVCAGFLLVASADARLTCSDSITMPDGQAQQPCPWALNPGKSEEAESTAVPGSASEHTKP